MPFISGLITDTEEGLALVDEDETYYYVAEELLDYNGVSSYILVSTSKQFITTDNVLNSEVLLYVADWVESKYLYDDEENTYDELGIVGEFDLLELLRDREGQFAFLVISNDEIDLESLDYDEFI